MCRAEPSRVGPSVGSEFAHGRLRDRLKRRRVGLDSACYSRYNSNGYTPSLSKVFSGRPSSETAWGMARGLASEATGQGKSVDGEVATEMGRRRRGSRWTLLHRWVLGDRAQGNSDATMPRDRRRRSAAEIDGGTGAPTAVASHRWHERRRGIGRLKTRGQRL